jgi:hypothetical protein
MWLKKIKQPDWEHSLFLKQHSKNTFQQLAIINNNEKPNRNCALLRQN